MLRIQQKIVLLSCMMAWGATLVAGYIDYRDDTRQARMQSELVLTAQAELVQNRIRLGFARMAQDARLITSSPILTRKPDGLATPGDQLDLDGIDRASLERVLRIVIATRPDYSEVALVKFDDEGSEIVRVYRKTNGIAVSESEDLQSRQNEDVYDIARATTDREWNFTGVRPPPARQTNSLPLRPSVSLVYPVSRQNGEYGGFLLITSDARRLVGGSLLDLRLTNSLFVLSGSGDLLGSFIRPADLETQIFGNPPSYSDIPAEFQFDDRETGTTTRIVNERGQVFLAYDRRSEDSDFPGIKVVMAKPIAEMLHAPAEAARRSVLVGGLATFLSGLIAGIFAFWVTRPLRQIADSLRSYDWQGPLDGLPVHLRDEVGDVARSFQNLITRLNQSEKRAAAIMESLSDALIIIDTDGRILEFSDVAEKMFQYKREEVIGQNAKVLLTEPFRGGHDEYFARFRRSRLQAAASRVRKLKAVRKNGEIFPVELSVSVVGQSEHIAYVGIVRDITECRQAEEMKNAVISTVNHELRTPLTAINTALYLVRENAGEDLDPRSRDMIELAQSGSARLTQLVNDILDLRRIEAGLVIYHTRTLDLCALAANIVERFKPVAERCQVKLVCDFPDEVVLVRLDAERFEQAMINLLSNAVKFSPAGEAVTIAMIRRGPDFVRINVTDIGPGIPKPLRNKIFQCFAQIGSHTKRAEASNGLGLAITKSLVEAFGGRISFDTEIGAGTTFHIELPVHHPVSKGWSDE